MHVLLDYSRLAFGWLTANSAANSTAILVLVTGWYALLTYRMSRAMARQTRAMVQPVVSLQLYWNQESYTPYGHFEVKNLGSQPVLLLDMKLTCVFGHWKFSKPREFIQRYPVWDDNIIPPGESKKPKFDFRRELANTGLPWTHHELSYELLVVTSDLSREVVLTYRNIPVLSIRTCRAGMPLGVRLRYSTMPLRNQFFRVKYLLRRRRKSPSAA